VILGLGIWPASLLMARYAIQMESLLRGKVVVELGSGCGVPGLAAGCLTSIEAKVIGSFSVRI
jgi:predicted nicotinamide N-methyase